MSDDVSANQPEPMPEIPIPLEHPGLISDHAIARYVEHIASAVAEQRGDRP